MKPVPAVRARLQLRRGALSDADAWVHGAAIAPDDELSYLREYEHVTLARVLLARHHVNDDDAALADAVSLLRRLHAAASEAGRVTTEIETLILLALAQQASGDVMAAQEALRQAVAIGQPEGYVRLFAEEDRPIATLLGCTCQAAERPRQPLLTSADWWPPLRSQCGRSLENKVSSLSPCQNVNWTSYGCSPLI